VDRTESQVKTGEITITNDARFAEPTNAIEITNQSARPEIALVARTNEICFDAFASLAPFPLGAASG
jgi:hypothetical protein